jgi:hypothetical protein
MAIHADDLAAPSEIAIRLLLTDQVAQSFGDDLGVSPVNVGVTSAQIRQKSQSRECGVGFPVSALAATGFADWAMGREVIVSLHGRPIVVARDPSIPTTVVILVPAQPIERSFHGQLAGSARADASRLCGAIRIEPGQIELRNLDCRRLTACTVP